MSAPPPAPIPFAEALRFWAWLGCVSFGGPAAQIAVMREELVDHRRWIDAERFDHALDFCMLLPGPEAQQLATWSGWSLHGARGGLAAGVLFVLPAALLLFALSWAYAAWGSLRAIEGVLWGCKAVVVGILLAAVVRLASRALRRPAHWLLAIGAFVALRAFGVSFPLVIFGAALVGLVLRDHAATSAASDANRNVPPAHGGLRRSLLVLAIGATAWGLPFAALWLGGASCALAREQYLFFSGAALVTFGGAYAVLAYVTQAAVDSLGWITATQAIDGLALAETTPGPLILVLQFVGFLTGWNHPGTLSPLAAATLGTAVTTWATFVPSFVFVFLGAPWIEALRRRRAIARALAGVTAAVLGVIANLGVVVAAAVLVRRSGDGALHVDWLAVALAAATFVLAVQRRLGVLTLVGLGALAGTLRALAM